MANLWLEVEVRLRHHPKLIATAEELGICAPHLLGHLVFLWTGVLENAEDGDLWRGDEEATLRFIRILSGWTGDVRVFMDALRKEGWLDGWLIHDWLDHVGRLLIKRYKTSNRKLLVYIWEKHGRVYGAKAGKVAGSDHEGRNYSGTKQEPVRNKKGSNKEAQQKQNTLQEPLPIQETKTLSPPARSPKKRKARNEGSGSLGDSSGQSPGSDGEVEPQAAEKTGDDQVLHFTGERAQGSETERTFPCAAITLKDVFDVFKNLLCFHGIYLLQQLHDRVKHCRVSPALWMMLFLDKVHAVYREREGGPLIESEDADPVAMTVAGLRPKKGAPTHTHTDAAMTLFVEIMVDYEQSKAGGRSRWQNLMSGPSITHELEKRKGGKGKLRKGA